MEKKFIKMYVLSKKAHGCTHFAIGTNYGTAFIVPIDTIIDIINKDMSKLIGSDGRIKEITKNFLYRNVAIKNLFLSVGVEQKHNATECYGFEDEIARLYNGVKTVANYHAYDVDCACGWKIECKFNHGRMFKS